MKVVQHGNIPLWAGHQLAGRFAGFENWFRGLAYWWLPWGFENRGDQLAGRCRDPWAQLVSRSLCYYIITAPLVAAGASGSICIAAHTRTHCAQQWA